MADERRAIARLQDEVAALEAKIPETRESHRSALEERIQATEDLRGIRRLREQAKLQRDHLRERFSQAEVKERELAKQVADAEAAQKVCVVLRETVDRR